MALRMIYSVCNGQGYLESFLISKKTCLPCNGTGFFIGKNFRLIQPGKNLNTKFKD